jgi:hypothetical protein
MYFLALQSKEVSEETDWTQNCVFSLAWWNTSIIPALGRLRQKNREFIEWIHSQPGLYSKTWPQKKRKYAFSHSVREYVSHPSHGLRVVWIFMYPFEQVYLSWCFQLSNIKFIKLIHVQFYKDIKHLTKSSFLIVNTDSHEQSFPMNTF